MKDKYQKIRSSWYFMVNVGIERNNRSCKCLKVVSAYTLYYGNDINVNRHIDLANVNKQDL